MLDRFDQVRFRGLDRSELVGQLPAPFTGGLGFVAKALNSSIHRRPKNSVVQGLNDGVSIIRKTTSERHRASRAEFRGGATKLRFSRRNFAAKLPRNSARGGG
jgi:hypothetical protein